MPPPNEQRAHGGQEGKVRETNTVVSFMVSERSLVEQIMTKHNFRLTHRPILVKHRVKLCERSFPSSGAMKCVVRKGAIVCFRCRL